MEKHTLATGAEDSVGTTGVFEIKPGAVNSVPREARLGKAVRERTVNRPVQSREGIQREARLGIGERKEWNG